MKYCVYAMTDPVTHDIFYVGETGALDRRKEQHLEGSDQISGLKVKMIKKAGGVPGFTVLERCPSEEAAMMAEITWIKLLLSLGAPLLNSQAFDGPAHRLEARHTLKAALDGLTGGKYGGDKLRHVANGRTYHNGRAGGETKPAPKKKPPPKLYGDQLLPWQVETLRKMNAKGMRVHDMAACSGIPVATIRQTLARLS